MHNYSRKNYQNAMYPLIYSLYAFQNSLDNGKLNEVKYMPSL